MQIRMVNRGVFKICGYSVETSLTESGGDVAALYSDYFGSDKAAAVHLAARPGAAAYYGLMWYLQGHERYRYLLGEEMAASCEAPANAEVKELPEALYAVAAFEKDVDAVKAWTDFFFEAIPELGYAPDYAHGLFFEYYPNGVNGDYELWTPVVKADV